MRIFSPADFERAFGGLNRDSETTYAVSQFFNNGGGDAILVRVAPGATPASIGLEDDGGSTVFIATVGEMVGDDSVENSGEWGNNVRIDLDYAASDPATEFNMTVTEVQIVDGREVVTRTETFRNLSMTAGAINNALVVVNNGSQLIQLSPGASTNRPAATGTLGDAGADPSTASGNSDLDMTVTIGATPVTETISTASADLPDTLAEARALLEQGIRAARPTEPLWSQATVTLVNGRLLVRLGRSGTDYDSEAIVSFADTSGDLGANMGLVGGSVLENVQQYRLGSTNNPAFQTAGSAGTNDTGATAAALAGSRAARSGIFALEDADIFNILCIPEASLLDSPGRDEPRAGDGPRRHLLRGAVRVPADRPAARRRERRRRAGLGR